MKKNEYMPKCNTQPGTEAWSRHVAEIKRLADQAQQIGNPGAMIALSMLYLWHKEKQWQAQDD